MERQENKMPEDLRNEILHLITHCCKQKKVDYWFDRLRNNPNFSQVLYTHGDCNLEDVLSILIRNNRHGEVIVATCEKHPTLTSLVEGECNRTMYAGKEQGMMPIITKATYLQEPLNVVLIKSAYGKCVLTFGTWEWYNTNDGKLRQCVLGGEKMYDEVYAMVKGRIRTK